jgi:hypothetical protein
MSAPHSSGARERSSARELSLIPKKDFFDSCSYRKDAAPHKRVWAKAVSLSRATAYCRNSWLCQDSPTAKCRRRQPRHEEIRHAEQQDVHGARLIEKLMLVVAEFDLTRNRDIGPRSLLPMQIGRLPRTNQYDQVELR